LKRVVVLGAGFSGLMTALKLEERVRQLSDVEVVLVDRNDYHQYLHLSYEIVTGVKKVSDLTVPLSELLAERKIRFVQETVEGIDLANRTVKTSYEDLPYSELVIALGSEPNYFGVKGARENSFSVSSVETAAQVRDRLKQVLGQAKSAKIVVGGGGFTGVEVAGEIADEYKCCVTIIEGAKTLLPAWGIPEFSRKVADVLTEMGAELVLGKFMAEVEPGAIVLNDGSRVEYSVLIWTAGVQASGVISDSGFKMGKDRRVLINGYCEAVGFPGVYVVGDCALVTDPKTGEVLPQCIELALQQADAVAQNLCADVTGGVRTVYTPKLSGLILTVGERYGIGKISGVRVEGRIALMVKRLIHLRYVYEIAGLKEVLKESF